MVRPKKKRRPRRRKRPDWVTAVTKIASAVGAIAGCIAPFVR